MFFTHHCYRDVKIFNFSLLMFFKVLDNWAHHSNFRFRIYGYTHLGFSKKCITHLYTCRLLEYEPGNFATKKISTLKIGFVNWFWTFRRNYNVERSKEGSKDGNHAAYYFWFSTFPLTDFCKNPIDAATNRHIEKNLARSTSFSFLVQKHSFCMIVS